MSSRFRTSGLSRMDSAVPDPASVNAPPPATLVEAISARLAEWHLLMHGLHMAMMEVAHASAVSIVKTPHPLGATTLSTQPYIVRKDVDGAAYRYIRIWPQVSVTLTIEMPSGPMLLALGPANAPALPLPDGAAITAPGGNVNVSLELTDYAG